MKNQGEQEDEGAQAREQEAERERTQGGDHDDEGYRTTTQIQGVIEKDVLDLTLSLPSSAPSSAESDKILVRRKRPRSLPSPHQQLRIQQETFPQTPSQLPVGVVLTDTSQLFFMHSVLDNSVLPQPPIHNCPPPLTLGSDQPPTKRRRQNSTKSKSGGKSDKVPVPFPWATDQRAVVHRLEHLRSENIDTITGKMKCKKCEREYVFGFELQKKFVEVGDYIAKNWNSMKDRAPVCWTKPVLPNCTNCNQENGLHPVITKKRTINWLFLLLGQMLGCCTIEQLRYFCKHNNKHRTGAKDRLLYLTYLGLCNQVDPNGPFRYRLETNNN